MRQRSVDDPAAILALSAVTALGALFFNTQPVLLGALAETFGFAEQQLGTVATAGLLGACAVIVTAFYWVPRSSWRLGITGGVSVTLLGAVLLTVADGYAGVLIGVVLMAVGMAAAYAPALAALSTARDPTRSFGVAITVQVLVASASVFVIPALLLPRFGLVGLTAYVAAVAGFTLLLLPLIPANSARAAIDVGEVSEGAGPARLAWLGLLAMAVYFSGLNGTWAFLERIGAMADLGSATVGAALSVSLLVSVVGSASAAALSRRVSVPGAMAVSVLLFGGFVALIADVSGPWRFGIAIALFNVAWNFSLPFQMNIVARADRSGRFVVLIPAAQTLGAAAGPAVAGTLLMSGGTAALYTQLLVCVSLGCLIYVLVSRKLPAIEQI